VLVAVVQVGVKVVLPVPVWARMRNNVVTAAARCYRKRSVAVLSATPVTVGRLAKVGAVLVSCKLESVRDDVRRPAYIGGHPTDDLLP